MYSISKKNVCDALYNKKLLSVSKHFKKVFSITFFYKNVIDKLSHLLTDVSLYGKSCICNCDLLIPTLNLFHMVVLFVHTMNARGEAGARQTIQRMGKHTSLYIPSQGRADNGLKQCLRICVCVCGHTANYTLHGLHPADEHFLTDRLKLSVLLNHILA